MKLSHHLVSGESTLQQVTGYKLQVTLFEAPSRIFLLIKQSCVALFCCCLAILESSLGWLVGNKSELLLNLLLLLQRKFLFFFFAIFDRFLQAVFIISVLVKYFFDKNLLANFLYSLQSLLNLVFLLWNLQTSWGPSLPYFFSKMIFAKFVTLDICFAWYLEESVWNIFWCIMFCWNCNINFLANFCERLQSWTY